MRENANEYRIPYSLSVFIGSFAKKWQYVRNEQFPSILATEQQKHKITGTTNIYQIYVSTVINTHIQSFHNTFSQVPIL